jgi:DNA-binding protein HU-beta
MIKKDIIDKATERVDEPRPKIQETIDQIFKEIKMTLVKGERIELRGFGVFEVKPRKTGVGRNPKTGVPVKIGPGKKVKFRPGKRLSNI